MFEVRLPGWFPNARRRRTTLVAASAALLGVYVSTSARADAPLDKKVCIAAAERGQELREAKQMRDARAQFALCGRQECPATVAKECVRWGAEAEAALGSVKLEAVDAAGHALGAVKVLIDGSPWSDEVPAEAILLDPGSHEIRFEHSGDAAVTRSLTLTMGDRDRVVRATFGGESPPKPGLVVAAPVAPSAPSSSGGGSIVLPVVLGSVGAVAAGTAVVFWLLGNSDLDDARARCAHGCAASEADSARTKHLVGDISMAAGVVAIGAAAYFLFTREKPRSAASLAWIRF
jgi:hypothetical protein